MEFKNGKPIVYLDNAATTKPLPEVIEKATTIMENYYNPSAAYDLASYVKEEVEQARQYVANSINAQPNEIFFTSGGTEADNWALKATLKPGDHLITSSIEHKAILNTAKYLESIGVKVTYLPADRVGLVKLEDVKRAIRPNTKLISIMLINNEIGCASDFYGIGEIAKKHNILYHSDAVQAYGKYILNMSFMPFDMVSLSAHKINGLKGTGALYVRGGKIDSFIHGGGQESGLRSGTENVVGIAAMGRAAAELDKAEIHRRWENVSYLYNTLIDNIIHTDFLSYKEPVEGYSGYVLNPYTNPYIMSIIFPGLRGEQIARLLDANGICVSTGSACNAHSAESSHVLKAIGVSDENANSSIRVSLSHNNTPEEIEYFIKVLKQVITQLKGIKKEE